MCRKRYRVPGFVILFYLLIYFTGQPVYSQDFKREPLVTFSGNNINFSISSPNMYEFRKSYICWENILNNKHTIYMKKIDPLSDSIFVVWSDAKINTNPVIAFNSNDQTILIVWQHGNNNQWQLIGREFKDNAFTQVQSLTDPQKNSISPSLSNNGLTWIEDGKLLYSRILEDPIRTDSIMVIDSNSCMNPKIYPYDTGVPRILYEKGDSLNKQIYSAAYLSPPQIPVWKLTLISNGEQNQDPVFSLSGRTIYETKENNVWKIVYENLKTGNVSCNYEHPSAFDYAVPVKISQAPLTGYFFTYDSDSLQNNKEVYLRMTVPVDSTINLSDSPGNDEKPMNALLSMDKDSSKVAVIWEHTENGKSDLWWAVSPFKFPVTDVKSDNPVIIDFSLSNYPNPFNQTTVIKYSLPEKTHVIIKLYDILGREISVLLNDFKDKGKYSLNFDASGLTSGVYLYRIETNKLSQTKKLVLMK